MVAYHADADTEFEAILRSAGRDMKKCLGQMIQRHQRIAWATEPLAQAELVGAGSGASTIHRVEYSYGLFALMTSVYGVNGSMTEVLALDAWQWNSRLGLPAHAPDALARAWGRST